MAALGRSPTSARFRDLDSRYGGTDRRGYGCTDVEVPSDEARMRPADSEVERLFAGVEKARKLFGWLPAHGAREGFARGIAKTAEWFQDPTNLSIYKASKYNL